MLFMHHSIYTLFQAERPSKRVTVVDLDKATPMKIRNDNMDLGPISPVDKLTAMQMLDSKER